MVWYKIIGLLSLEYITQLQIQLEITVGERDVVHMGRYSTGPVFIEL
jgi:hypothetical protein